LDVAVIKRKQELFQNIVRLRRASLAVPSNRDITAVQTALEDELGGSVSRRLAASLLGVSHTALTRWIEAGDIPVVYGSSGRTELPVPALLDLYEAVQHERAVGRRHRHLLEPMMLEGRKLAERIDAADLTVGDVSDAEGHRRAELRSLAYHRALARRLRRPMVDEARHVLWKWRDQGKIDARYAQPWEELLDRPLPEIRRILVEDTPKARDLRQNSPFAGMLSEPERRRIMQAIR